MYNRYIPAPDGTFRREIVQDLPLSPRPEPITVQYESVSETAKVEKNGHVSKIDTPPEFSPPETKPNAALTKTGVLKKIVPPSIDTGDLLVLLILLLLLVDGDEDDYLSVLLTIAAFILL